MTNENILIFALIMLLGIVCVWFLYSLFWGKPWSVNLLYLRTFLWFAVDNPELLTTLGILEKLGITFHNAKLSDISIAHETRMIKRLRKDLAILRSYDKTKMSQMQRLSTEILEWFLENQAERFEPFRFHDYPLNQMFGIQSQSPNFMMTVHPLDKPIEADHFIRRLGQFGKRFDQVMENLLIREQKGVIPPKFVIRHVIDEMTAFSGTAADENPLYIVFAEKTEKIKKLSPAERLRLLDRVAREIERTVYPAYRKVIDYLQTLEGKATTDDGVWKLPDGDAFYAYCLWSNTTTEASPKEVHETGVREVARIEGEMREILGQLGLVEIENPAARLAELAREERFLFSNDETGRAAALETYQKILDEMGRTLGKYFNVLPKAKLKVARVPVFLEKTSALAYYQMGDLSGNRPGTFYANLRDMKEIYRFGMKTLAYHEGIPGHHFQLAIAMELKGVPFFRRLVPFTAYAEGWALYAERLAAEMGVYGNDPYGDLGRLDAELFRAVRLVVDTGIHSMRWTREQAIAYMEAHSASAHESVVSEIERYIVMPGQACAYKMGMLKILALREKAQQALGERFDLRWFHDLILLNGAMPLALLERLVEEAAAT